MNTASKYSKLKDHNSEQVLENGSNMKQKRSLAEFQQQDHNTFSYGVETNDQVEIVDSNSQSLLSKRKRLRKYNDQIKDEPDNNGDDLGKGALQTDLCTNDITSALDTNGPDYSQSLMPPPVAPSQPARRTL